MLSNPIIYWYTTDGYSHHSVLNVWDYMVANKIIGKPVAMCRKEYLRLHPEIDMSKASRYVGNYEQSGLEQISIAAQAALLAHEFKKKL